RRSFISSSESHPMPKTTRFFARRGRVAVLSAGLVFVLFQAASAGLLKHVWPTPETPAGVVQSERFWSGEPAPRGVPSLEESIIQWQAYHLLTSVDDQNVLFVGDSSCLMGVMPQVIAQKTGQKCWNLGTIGFMATDGHADMLDLYLAKNRPPQL